MSATSAAGFGLRRLVDIGEDRKALGLHAGQNAQAFAQARPAIGVLPAGAVGLVERSLEDEGRPRHIAMMPRAIRWTCSSLSMTHGPAISTSGRGLVPLLTRLAETAGKSIATRVHFLRLRIRRTGVSRRAGSRKLRR
jgi:hypothetical protein